jgi:hypothetical protein
MQWKKQCYGRFGAWSVSSPSLITFGEMTEDEFFVTAQAAKTGVQITKLSSSEPLVMPKHLTPIILTCRAVSLSLKLF